MKAPNRLTLILSLGLALGSSVSFAQAQDPAQQPAPQNPDHQLPVTPPNDTPPSAAPSDIQVPDTAGQDAVLETLVTRTLTVPANATETLVFQPLPDGVSFVAGSVRVNGAALGDSGTVLVSGRGVYVRLQGAVNGEVQYRLGGVAPGAAVPAAALGVRYAQDRNETLSGTIDPADLRLAKPAAVTVPERAGVIRSPQDNLVLRGRNSVDVTVDVPLGEDESGNGALTVNGEPVEAGRIGERSVYRDGHTRLKFIAVPLSPGVNALAAFGDTVSVTTAGPASRLQVTPQGPLIADGSTPLRFDLDVQDAAGHPAELPGVSVTVVGSEPQDTDADPLQSGYQVRLQQGQGRLTLRPASQPGPVTLTFDVNGHTQVQRFEVSGDRSRLVVAHNSVTVSGGQADWQGAASIEAPILDGKLYVAANSDGVNQTPLPYSRYPAYGDSSVGTQPLHAQGRLALRLDLPRVRADYQQDAAQDPVFGVQTGVDSLNIETRGETRFGFGLAQVPGTLRSVTLMPDGTRLLRLPEAAVPNSQTVVLVRSRGGTETGRRTLTPGLDYVLGEPDLLEFPAPLLPFSPEGEDVRLLVTYLGAPDGSGAGSVTAGVHVTRDLTFEHAQASVSAGAVLIRGVPSVGVHARVTADQGAGDVLLAGSGGAVFGSVTGSYKAGRVTATGSGRFEGEGYTGPGAGSPGLTLAAAAEYRLDPQFGVRLAVNGSRDDRTLPDGTVSGPSSLVASAGVTYVAAPWRSELALRRNFSAGTFGVQGTVGYTREGVDVTLTHAQDFGAGQSLSSVSATVPLAPDLRLNVTAGRDWRLGTLQASASLQGLRAGVNYIAGYDLPTEGGSFGRARLSATTSIPIDRTLSTDVSASVSAERQEGLIGAVGATLRYQDQGSSASLGADTALTRSGLKFDVKAAANVAYGKEWTVSGDLLSEFGAVTPGTRFGIGAAWRGNNASALAYLRYRSGSFGDRLLTGELDLEQRPDLRGDRQRQEDQGDLNADASGRRPVALRESLAISSPMQGAMTFQGLLGAHYWVNDRLSLGLGLGAAYQVGLPLGTRLGVEATYVPVPGWGITAGYNLYGFDSNFGHEPMKPGLYFKLDLLLDEVGR